MSLFESYQNLLVVSDFCSPWQKVAACIWAVKWNTIPTSLQCSWDWADVIAGLEWVLVKARLTTVSGQAACYARLKTGDIFSAKASVLLLFLLTSSIETKLTTLQWQSLVVTYMQRPFRRSKQERWTGGVITTTKLHSSQICSKIQQREVTEQMGKKKKMKK